MDPEEIVLPVLGFPVTFDDLHAISQARDGFKALTLILDIIGDMEPHSGARRVYVCEPRTSSRPRGPWDTAYDLTVTALTEIGDHVIDPQFLTILMAIHPTLETLVSGRRRNPLLDRLIDKGLLDAICLPGNVSESEYDFIRRRSKPSPCPSIWISTHCSSMKSRSSPTLAEWGIFCYYLGLTAILCHLA